MTKITEAALEKWSATGEWPSCNFPERVQRLFGEHEKLKEKLETTKAEKHFSYELLTLEMPQKVYVLLGPDDNFRTVYKTVSGAMKAAGEPFYGPIDDHVQKCWFELITDLKGNIRTEPWLYGYVIYEEELKP